MNAQEANDLIAGIEKVGDAFAVLHALYSKFDFAGTTFCPNDLEDYIANCRDADGEPPLSPDDMEKWVNDLLLSYEWTKGLSDRLTEDGWELIGMAYDDLKAQHSGASSIV